MTPSAALLYVSPARVLYRGPLGHPRIRTLGATACYLSFDSSLSVTCPDGRVWDGAHAMCMPAGVPHQISTLSGEVLCFLVEREFVDLSGILAPEPNVFDGRGLGWGRLGSLGPRDIRSWRSMALQPDAELDRLILGEAIPHRMPDPRIADVVHRIRLDPTLSWQAADAAAHCGVSASRFMHLFKSEVGVGWRAFRAWKRARALLERVHTGENLTQLALSLGYPDGTHFSHAIRQITGLRPSDIISGSRNLSVWNESGVSRDAAS